MRREIGRTAKAPRDLQMLDLQFNTISVYQEEPLVQHYLSNTTCLAHNFFNRGESFGR